MKVVLRDLRARACRPYECLLASEYAGGVPRAMWTFYRTKIKTLAATHCVLAHARGELVGMLVYDRRVKVDRGTYVVPGYRGRGIAKAMWRRVLDGSPVTIKALNRGGSLLIRSLSRAFPVTEMRLW